MPLLSEVALFTVPAPVIEIFAPGTTAPVSSATCPVKVTFCANAAAAASMTVAIKVWMRIILEGELTSLARGIRNSYSVQAVICNLPIGTHHNLVGPLSRGGLR